MKIYSVISRSVDMKLLSDGLRRGQPHGFAHAWMDHVSRVRHQRFAYDFIARSRVSCPSLMRYFKNVAMFLAYIWLAW